MGLHKPDLPDAVHTSLSGALCDSGFQRDSGYRLVGSRAFNAIPALRVLPGSDTTDFDLMVRGGETHADRVRDRDRLHDIIVDRHLSDLGFLAQDSFAGFPGLQVGWMYPETHPGCIFRAEVLFVSPPIFERNARAYSRALVYAATLTLCADAGLADAIAELDKLSDMRRSDKPAFYAALSIPFPNFGVVEASS